jgi:hypothetical protein
MHEIDSEARTERKITILEGRRPTMPLEQTA